MSKYHTNSTNNDTVDNQDDLDKPEMIKIVGIKQSDTIPKLDYYKVYILDIMGDNLSG